MRSIVASAGLLASAALPLLAPTATAQTVTQQDDDPVTIVGTWSSGSGGVNTGLSFFNPGNNSFIVPKTSGQSYSFTEDGFWEQALYIYSATENNPDCKQAQLIWQHGTFRQNGNGSLSLTPFEGDGRQLIQSGCTHTTQSIVAYDQPEYMQGFNIRLDMHYGTGAYYLQLFEFDGTPKPWLWQTYNPPQMLPTQQLHKKIIGSLNG